GLICVKAGAAGFFEAASMNMPGLCLPPVRMLSLLALVAFATSHSANAVDSSATVKKLFAKPTREYSTGPLWVLNDLLAEDQIRDTLRDLASQQVKQVWVHPRPG